MIPESPVLSVDTAALLRSLVVRFPVSLGLTQALEKLSGPGKGSNHYFRSFLHGSKMG